jgi:hypothetical protein
MGVYLANLLAAIRHQRGPILWVDFNARGANGSDLDDAVMLYYDIHRARGRCAGAVNQISAADDELIVLPIAMLASRHLIFDASE